MPHTPEYRAWHQMRQRCNNPKSPNYKNYGARGITVCERWNDSRAFLADMGPRPSPKHSLDRIDNSKGYSPDNCRWATWTEQNSNRRKPRLIEACKHGHPWVPENWHVNGRGWRHCKVCNRIRAAARYHRLKAANNLAMITEG